MKALKSLGIIALVIALMVGGCAYQMNLWNECRATPHTFFYCMHTLGRK
jgi:hypothetical protein